MLYVQNLKALLFPPKIVPHLTLNLGSSKSSFSIERRLTERRNCKSDKKGAERSGLF